LTFGVQSIDRQEANGGGYGIGLAYSRDMIHPPAPAASS